ncbi:MAG: glycosyl transferase family 39 [Desulfurococcaceae archaeon]
MRVISEVIRIVKRIGNYNAIIALVLFVIAIIIYYNQAHSLFIAEITRGGKGYVSDEVWYVGSARVILYKLFRLEPKMHENEYSVTVICNYIDTGLINDLTTRYNVTVKLADFYQNLKNAIYVIGLRDSVEMFLAELNNTLGIKDAIPGWAMPDSDGINNYINWEHPPLAKYIIALIMFAIGDQPMYWRIPVIIAGALAVSFTYLIIYSLTSNVLIGVITSILLLSDQVSRALFSIGLLDGYVALFTLLVMYFSINRKYEWALVMGIIGGLFKFSGLFALIPVILLMVRRDLKANPRVYQMINSTVKYVLATILLFLICLTVVSIPIIMYMGLGNWIEYSLLGSFKWHTSIKCYKPDCPISSAPWEWFLGINSFPLYVYPDGSTLLSSGFYPIWSTSLFLLTILTPAAFFSERKYGWIWLFFVSILIGYIGLWILGGRTQYSFYSVHLVPFVYMNLTYSVAYIISDRNKLLNVLNKWIHIPRLIVKIITY